VKKVDHQSPQQQEELKVLVEGIEGAEKAIRAAAF